MTINLKVSLTKRISTPEGFRYCSVVMSGNGRKPGAVIVNGQEEKHPKGAYYIDWYEGVRGSGSQLVKIPRQHSPESSAKRPN